MAEGKSSGSSEHVRVQPLLVEVPEDEPFTNDLLGRQQFGEALAASLEAIEGAGVFALDGRWGTGKTTFVRMLTQHLRNKGFEVIEINAWETDFTGEPLAALSSALVSATPANLRDDLKKRAIELIKIVGPSALRLATAGVLSIDATLEKNAGDIFAKWAESGLSRFENRSKSLDSFREQLERLAKTAGQGRPIVVMVDELDRCRPTYAVEMLETIKHVFDVPGILFVLALNRVQLDNSATTLYGDFVDPESYFRRFFDVELRLPDPDRETLVRDVQRQFGLRHDDVPANMLTDFLAASPLGIREITKAVQHYGIVRASLHPDEKDSWWWMLATFILLRMIDEDRYRAFLAGQTSDGELIDSIFGKTWTNPLRGGVSANVVEATAIRVSSIVNGSSTLWPRYEDQKRERESWSDQGERDIGFWVRSIQDFGYLSEGMVSLVARRVEMLDLRREGASR